MVKIARPKQSYDSDLAAQGLIRTYRSDMDPSGRPVYRELILKCDEFTTDRRPWWKSKRKVKK